MISGLLTLLLIVALQGAEASDDLDDLVSALAEQPSGEALRFRESRESALLSDALVVRGRLWRDRQGRLIRHTVEPREVTYTLGAGMVVIEQPGRAARNLSLRHAPELAVLYHGLSALLAGDANSLREHFEYRVERSDEAWQLELVPRAADLAERVESFTLYGSADQLERSVLSLADGQTITTEMTRLP